jgi:hypothetical protein
MVELLPRSRPPRDSFRWSLDDMLRDKSRNPIWK